jgi:ubiquinone biosynthesis protein COQ4
LARPATAWAFDRARAALAGIPPQEREIAGACKEVGYFHVDNNAAEAIFIMTIAHAGAASMSITASPSASPSTSGAATFGAARPPFPGGAQVSPGADPFELPFAIRARRAASALGKLLRDPYDTEQVFVLSTHINVGAIRRRLPRFYASADGRRLYEGDLSIDTAHVDLDALAELPDGTLGREYVRFLRDRGLSPDLFQAPAHVVDRRAAYVMKRLRQTHDLWHLLTGHATNPPGEVALQAFTFGQLGAPSAALIALLGTLREVSGRRTLPREVLAAYRAGRRAAPLAAVVWEDHWSEPLPALRQRLGIEPVTGAVCTSAAS